MVLLFAQPGQLANLPSSPGLASSASFPLALAFNPRDKQTPKYIYVAPVDNFDAELFCLF